jgi:hypothetical protein
MAKAHITAGGTKPIVKKTAHEMEGRKAPPFELSDGHGKTVSLKELLGRGNLVLYFYPKDMTPRCTVEATSATLRLASKRRAHKSSASARIRRTPIVSSPTSTR